MINLMRNLGGSIGISAVTTLIARRSQVHQAYLASNTYQFNPRFQQLLSQLSTRIGSQIGSDNATLPAYRQIYELLQRQATVLAYIDTFRIAGTLCLVAILIVFFAKKNKPGRQSMAH